MKSLFPYYILFVILGLSCGKTNDKPAPNPPAVIPTDSLLDWTVVSTLPDSMLNDIWFVSGKKGFLISKYIYQSNDGGETWAVIPTAPVLDDYVNLFFVNDQIGFAESLTKLVLTTDGGATWRSRSLASSTAISIFFPSGSTGFYGDRYSNGLRKTTDSGKTWKVVLNSSPAVYFPYFLNTDTGFSISGKGQFSSTTDGGTTWNSAQFDSLANGGSYNQLFFLNSKTGFFAGGHGVFQTIDGGQSWQHRIGLSGAYESVVNVIRFVDANTGFYKSERTIYKTSDGGITWSIDCKLNDFSNGMSILDKHHGWACTSKGRILRFQN